MSRVFLNTYEPLCLSPQGRAAIKTHNLPPFIDGSCRREPDLEGNYPAISALCRGGLFVPRLRVGDKVVYLTKKGKYGDLPPHWRLVAAVEIAHCFASHEEAADWYRQQGETLPRNCIVPGNPPVPWDETHQRPNLPDGEPKTLENWDSKYSARAAMHGEFCACRAVFRNLQDPPVLFEADMRAAFADYGRIPITQNPPAISEGDYQRLLAFANQKETDASPT